MRHFVVMGCKYVSELFLLIFSTISQTNLIILATFERVHDNWPKDKWSNRQFVDGNKLSNGFSVSDIS